MNGKTDIDAILNPASAEMDKRTYGFARLNFCVYGSRLVRFTIGRLTVDLYKGVPKSFLAKGGGANGSSSYRILFWQGGQIIWITSYGKGTTDAD